MKPSTLFTPAVVLMLLSQGCTDPHTTVGNGPHLGEMKWINLPAGVTKLTSGDLAGRAVMMEFWATW